MKPVFILEGHDTIQPDDWCRPLVLETMSGGASDSMSFKSCYTGTPENNVMWAQVKHVMGRHWYGRQVSEYHKFIPTEFMRGEPPVEHQLDLTEYTSLWNP